MVRKMLIVCQSRRRKAVDDMLMTTGTDLRRIESRPAFSTSEDGIIWSDPINPFGQIGNAIGVASGSGITIILNDRGMVAHSSNLTDWNVAAISDGYFSPRAINHGIIGTDDPIWMMVGQMKFPAQDGPYGELDEAAQIFRNTSGSADDWELIYSHAPDSIFHGIRFLNINGVDTWLALGTSQGNAVVMYSVDSGISWHQIQLPALKDLRIAYDAAVGNGRLWITVNSIVLSLPEAQILAPSAAWDASPLLVSKFGSGDLVKIAANGSGKVVAASSAGLYITNDLTSWELFSVPGYRFRSCYWDSSNQLWLAGADSQLMRFTLWTSRDSLTWSESNNLVQAFDFVSI
jgi:hypothetical protein